MNRKLLGIVMALALPAALFAQESSSPLSFDMSVDFAYHPHADYIPGGNHYSPLTGAYESLEGRIIGNMNYVIPTPLGDNWLVKDANVKLQANLELTPVSVKPGLHVEFTPVPFLVFSAGAQAGTGWDLFGIIGAGGYDGIETYTAYKPFEAWLLKWYVQGTFQFDTGVVWPGDWNHVQVMYSYQVYYEGLANCANGDLWMWQGVPNKANGICNYQNLIVAYQMPLVLSRVGVMFELNGHYNAADYKGHESYKGDFMELTISPLAQFTITENDHITCMACFKTRRSFVEGHTKESQEPNLTYSGYEMYLNKIALRYEHKF